MEFHEIWYLSIFWISVKKIQVLLKSDQYNGYFTWRPVYIFYHILLTSSYNEKCFDKCCTENQTHILYSIMFFKDLCLLWDNVEKYCRARQPTDDNMVHPYCTLLPRATNTHCDYVVLIAFSLQHWLHECASISCNKYIACLV